jgi:hypothetical protein
METGGLLPQPPMVLLRRKTPQTIPAKVWTSVLWHAAVGEDHGEAVQAHFLPPVTGIYNAASQITVLEPDVGRLLVDVCVVGDREPMPAVRIVHSPDRNRHVDLDPDGHPIPWFATIHISGALVLDAARFESCDVRVFVDGPEAVLLPPNPSDVLAVAWNPGPL